jgi:hypothetical protein
MFQLQGKLFELELKHQHSDGSWGEMEAVPEDPADLDPERDWGNGGQIFACKACGEQVRVSHPADEPYSGATA